MKVKLDELAAALEKSDELQGYVDLENGRVILFGEEFSEEAEAKEESEEERLEHVFSIEDRWQQYVALPNIYDADECEIMRAFADDLFDETQAQALREALQGHGAVTRFERQLRKFMLQEAWQAFLHEHLREAARDWCEENDISYEE